MDSKKPLHSFPSKENQRENKGDWIGEWLSHLTAE